MKPPKGSSLPRPTGLPKPARPAPGSAKIAALPRPGASPAADKKGPLSLAERVAARKPVDKLAEIEAETDEALKAFKARSIERKKEALHGTDLEFWFCVSAVARAQKEWMLRQLGLFEAHDKYLTADEFWKAMRRLNPSLPPLPNVKILMQTPRRGKALAEIAEGLPEAND
jgi:hypothetical protein